MSMAVFTPLPDPMKIAAELRREIEKLRAQLSSAAESVTCTSPSVLPRGASTESISRRMCLP